MTEVVPFRSSARLSYRSFTHQRLACCVLIALSLCLVLAFAGEYGHLAVGPRLFGLILLSVLGFFEYVWQSKLKLQGSYYSPYARLYRELLDHPGETMLISRLVSQLPFTEVTIRHTLKVMTEGGYVLYEDGASETSLVPGERNLAHAQRFAAPG